MNTQTQKEMMKVSGMRTAEEVFSKNPHWTVTKIEHWNTRIITMPWGMKLYRWKGKTSFGFPKNLQFLNLSTNEWEECKNINVFNRIKNS